MQNPKSTFKAVLIVLFILLINLANAQITRRALFIGNSYIQENNLPLIVANIATNRGHQLIYDSHTPGGYTLNDHFANSTTQNKIKAGNWDYVILQEQSQLPSFEDYSEYAGRNLKNLTKQYNPCARTLFYMTWGRKNGDQSNCAVWPPVCTYEGMDSLLQLRYLEMTENTGAIVSPVGAVWRYVRENYPSIELYQPDESHPSAAGSYLAAMCFYTSLFEKDPSLVSYNFSLTPTVAAQIRDAVKIILWNKMSDWNFLNLIPQSSFTHEIGKGSNEVVLFNTSTNAPEHIWDFGDNQSSTAKNTIHNYANNGTYTITLTTKYCDLGVVYKDSIKKQVTFCPYDLSITPEDLLIYPGTTDTLWTQEYEQYQWMNESGDSILNQTNQYIIPEIGTTYTVRVLKNGCSEWSAPAMVNFYTHLGNYFLNTEGNFSNPDSICQGDSVILFVRPNKPPYPSDDQFSWYRNGTLINGSQNDSLLVLNSGNYKVVMMDNFCPDFTLFADSSSSFTFIDCDTTSTTSIDQKSIENLISIYPNPAEDILTINVSEKLKGTSFRIINLHGVTVLHGNLLSGKTVLNTSHLSVGIYFLQLENQPEVFKIIRN